MRRALVVAAVLASRLAVAGDDLEEPPAPLPEPSEDLSAPEPAPQTPRPEPVEPAPTPPPPVETEPSTLPSDEPTAADVADAPLPGEESGRTDVPAGDSVWRDVGQAVLGVPRVVLQTAFAPIRTGIWVYDRYSLSERFARAFFDRELTYGIYPTVLIDTVYGVNIGARLVHRNMFGAREKMSLRGTSGGQFRMLVDGSVRSGRRFGDHLVLELRGEYERRPADRFFGIGNNTSAMDSRYREEVTRVTTYLDVAITRRTHVRATGAITNRLFSPSSEGTPIDAAHDTSMLTGFDGGENLYGELELRWDRRGRQTSPGRHQIYDTGYMLSGFGGRVHQLEAGHDYWRYGGQAQHFLGLGAGPRSLMTRLHVETVTGGLEDVVFTQLPALGGSQLLRGYAPTRFRDRAAVVGTVEYFWGLGPIILGSVFVDVGRVYPSLAELTTDELRVGFGTSVQLHETRHFIAGLTLASSINGGFFASLTFDPVFEFDPRAERR